MASEDFMKPPSAEDDLLDWYAQLTQGASGVDVNGQSSDPLPETLRRAMRDAEMKAVAEENLEHDWQRLRFTLRREIDHASKSRTLWQFAALAATVLLVAGITIMLPHQSEDDPLGLASGDVKMRGVASEVVFSKDPSGEADRLERELVKSGVKVKRLVTAEKIELRIVLGASVSQVTKTILESKGIPVPEQGVLSVVYLPEQ